MSYLEWPVSQIATEIPGATAIFFQHKINFCCQGQQPLERALQQKGVDAEQVQQALDRLHQRGQQQPDWDALDNASLIEHILERFHEVHRQQLDELIRLAHRVETVHVAHPLCPTGLAAHLESMRAELLLHMQKEEAILFPMLTSGNAAMAAAPISVMQSEHLHHLRDIEEIYRLTQDVTPHAQACNTWRALYLGLQEFISDLNMHIHLENDILFQR